MRQSKTEGGNIVENDLQMNNKHTALWKKLIYNIVFWNVKPCSYEGFGHVMSL